MVKCAILCLYVRFYGNSYNDLYCSKKYIISSLFYSTMQLKWVFYILLAGSFLLFAYASQGNAFFPNIKKGIDPILSNIFVINCMSNLIDQFVSLKMLWAISNEQDIFYDVLLAVVLYAIPSCVHMTLRWLACLIFWDQVLRADNSSLAGDIRKEMKVFPIHTLYSFDMSIRNC